MLAIRFREFRAMNAIRTYIGFHHLRPLKCGQHLEFEPNRPDAELHAIICLIWPIGLMVYYTRRVYALACEST